MPESVRVASAAVDVSPRLLCILGMPRTGTNHLCSILSRFPEIESRFEIFHPVRSYSMRPDELVELSRLSGKIFEPSPENPEAVNAIRHHPDLALESILRLMGPEKRLLTFKVFSHHLSAQQVQDAIVARPDALIVFVRRRPIDAYVSHQKALELGQWSGIDTTDVKVRIDATNFLNWWQQAATWYQSLESACWVHGKPLHHLSYEEDIDAAPAHLAQRLCELLANSGISDLTIPKGDQLKGTSRQDRTLEVERRVANWTEFDDELSSMGASEKAFAPIPHFKPT